MKTIDKIMVAVDFSEYSLPAVQYAVDLAKDVDAEILLTNVINQRDIDMMNKVADRLPDDPVKKYLDESRKERQKLFQNLIDNSNSDSLIIKTNIRVGVPYEELMAEIETKKADLLIMATKGRSDFVDSLIGSCAKKMFRRCPIPLLSIRPDKAR